MARLLMVSVLVHGLHVGSETLPPLTTNTSKGTMAERAQRYSRGAASSTRPKDDVRGTIGTSHSSARTTTSTMDKSRFQNLTTAMIRMNLLIAIWPFFIFVGQNMTLALMPGGGAWSWTGLPYLLLSGLLILKAYRFRLWIHQSINLKKKEEGRCNKVKINTSPLLVKRELSEQYNPVDII